jgi:prepilin-type processing-associated H-X9-DG protein
MSRHNEPISDETLLGYVLEALPEPEQLRIDEMVARDLTLAQRVQDLRELLGPIQQSTEAFEPSANLTQSTMSFIDRAVLSGDAAVLDAQPTLSQPLFETTRAIQVAWLDSFVALAAGVVILCLVLPSIFQSRESARKLGCSDNLREFGQSIRSFALINAKQQLPRIDVGGPLSFAGVFPMRLRDTGLLETLGKVWCPAMDRIEMEGTPTTVAFLTAPVSTQNNWRYTAGGNYYYNLGYMKQGVYTTPSIDSELCFPVMGDAVYHVDQDSDLSSLHGRHRANLLFADGRVRYVRLDNIDGDSIDHPYLNRNDVKAAGLSQNDSCLGPGFQFPLIPQP